LAALDNLLHEEILRESAIVSVIMEDLDSVRASKPFEGALGFNRFITRSGLLVVDIAPPTVVVDKDGCTCVASLGWLAFQLSNEAWRA
jgi:hypothetical protein